MFDTIRVGGGTHHHSVIERRAPTDESVRLLREMEEAAEKRVLERGELRSNELNVRWSIYHDRVDLDGITVNCRWKLNGVERTFEFPMCRNMYQDPKSKFIEIRDRLTEKIAEEVLMPLVTDSDKLRTIAGR